MATEIPPMIYNCCSNINTSTQRRPLLLKSHINNWDEISEQCKRELISPWGPLYIG